METKVVVATTRLSVGIDWLYQSFTVLLKERASKSQPFGETTYVVYAYCDYPNTK